jgi:hypothetical protein
MHDQPTQQLPAIRLFAAGIHAHQDNPAYLLDHAGSLSSYPNRRFQRQSPAEAGRNRRAPSPSHYPQLCRGVVQVPELTRAAGIKLNK